MSKHQVWNCLQSIVCLGGALAVSCFATGFPNAFHCYPDRLSLHPNESTRLHLVGGNAPYDFALTPPAPYGGTIAYRSGDEATFTAPAEAPYPVRPDRQSRLYGVTQIQVTDASGHMFVTAVEILVH